MSVKISLRKELRVDKKNSFLGLSEGIRRWKFGRIDGPVPVEEFLEKFIPDLHEYG